MPCADITNLQSDIATLLRSSAGGVGLGGLVGDAAADQLEGPNSNLSDFNVALATLSPITDMARFQYSLNKGEMALAVDRTLSRAIDPGLEQIIDNSNNGIDATLDGCPSDDDGDDGTGTGTGGGAVVVARMDQTVRTVRMVRGVEMAVAAAPARRFFLTR